ncbi:tail fiber assembly protein [Pseudomonas gingeri]|uniref:tail fiber assembly protein n=1 Tax=Pseudomonas gingeri TaxID=117681 RepID=UPI0015A0710A|nr:tail fiber assembly protein [Pseudomonas gingeri]NWD68161.1 tail fiber assembly protein [Pseudomonas gingeri]
MKYYINRATGEIFAFESDGSQDSYISPGLELLDEKGLAEARAAQEAALRTPEVVLQEANAQRSALLVSAALHIAPLQYAVDLGEATDAESASLPLWKRYYLAVNRVSEQPGFPTTIDWPAPPV